MSLLNSCTTKLVWTLTCIAVACSLQELIALRKLQKSQVRQGIDVNKLNRGSDSRKRTAAPAADAGMYFVT